MKNIHFNFITTFLGAFSFKLIWTMAKHKHKAPLKKGPVGHNYTAPPSSSVAHNSRPGLIDGFLRHLKANAKNFPILGLNEKLNANEREWKRLSTEMKSKYIEESALRWICNPRRREVCQSSRYKINSGNYLPGILTSTVSLISSKVHHSTSLEDDGRPVLSDDRFDGGLMTGSSAQQSVITSVNDNVKIRKRFAGYIDSDSMVDADSTIRIGNSISADSDVSDFEDLLALSRPRSC